MSNQCRKHENINLKKAQQKDWSTVLDLEKKAESEMYPSFTKENEIKRYINKSTVFLINIDKKAVGTISYENKDKNSVYFDGLTVLPKYRRKQIASEAFRILLSKLTTIDKFTAVSHPENTPSLIIFLKLGFKIVGWKENYFGDNEARVLLERNL